MSRVGVSLVILLSSALSLGAQGGLRVEAVDGLVSIQADRVPLGTLLQELDSAAGTTSVVPPGLVGQPVSVWFSDLPVRQAVKKVFEGLTLDYAVVQGTQIVVLNPSGPDAAVANSLGAPPSGFRIPSSSSSSAEAQRRQNRDLEALVGRAGNVLELLQGGAGLTEARTEIQELMREFGASGGRDVNPADILEQLRGRIPR